MSNNYQNIIKRIDDIRKEIGLMSNTSGGNNSLRDLSEQILQKLTSTYIGDINGMVLYIFNETENILNYSSNINSRVNQIYTWFSNIYNELNSTSTSYMKGKINNIYSWSSGIYTELDSTSTNYTKGMVTDIYNTIRNGSLGGGLDPSRIRFETAFIKGVKAHGGEKSTSFSGNILWAFLIDKHHHDEGILSTELGHATIHLTKSGSTLNISLPCNGPSGSYPMFDISVGAVVYR